MALAASVLAILGGNSRLAATPTAAPTKVSAIRCHAADSALKAPTPSTSMALIATSSRLAPRRSAWPIAMEMKISRPRLHHSSGTMTANATARATPATTATTLSRPLASSEPE